MKKLFALLVCVLLVFALASCGGDICSHRDADDNSLCDKCGESYTDSLKLKYTLNENGTEYSVAGIGSCTDADVIIPSIYAGLPVTSIGISAFYDCDSLTSVVIPDSVTSIGDSAFEGCDSLTSVVIGNSVTSIGEGAFYSCDNLTSVVLPDSVTSIGYYAFCNCYSLTSITVDTNNQHYKDIDGNLYSKDGKILIQYAIGKTDTSFTIPDSVTSIGNHAFSSCYNLTSVVIPDSVTSIGYHAFSFCDSLTSVVIPDSVTSIGSYAFRDCDSLTSVVIGNSVTSIGEWAFYYCTSLTSIKYRGTQSQWNAISKGYAWNGNTGNYTITCNYEGE